MIEIRIDEIELAYVCRSQTEAIQMALCAWGWTFTGGEWRRFDGMAIMDHVVRDSERSWDALLNNPALAWEMDTARRIWAAVPEFARHPHSAEEMESEIFRLLQPEKEVAK